ncbi:MAG: helix-turn-helix domain-containing protein, partial [Solirubrobacteraceae bacterium]
SVATTVSEALQCPVAIAIPALGRPVVHPAGSLTPSATEAIAAHAAAVSRGENVPAPEAIAEAVPVRIGDQIVGIVAAGVLVDVADDDGTGDEGTERRRPPGDRHAWLEAAAAAASVTALIRDADGGSPGAGQNLVADLAAGPPEDLAAFVARARRLGLELGSGAAAISARSGPGDSGPPAESPAGIDRPLVQQLCAQAGALAAMLAPGQLVAIAPVTGSDGESACSRLADELRTHGLTVAVSAPRRDPAMLHGAIHEALLLSELGTGPGESAGQDETYRLLIGVLLREADQLARLRDRTILPLADYDDRHDTDLVATLRAFLAHDGSTTETAEAMNLHRHTVGYRLSRVHEVSGLSPYESDGRERLSLGLKAHDILTAQRRLDLASLNS